jgi:hypothetical protein
LLADKTPTRQHGGIVPNKRTAKRRTTATRPKRNRENAVATALAGVWVIVPKGEKIDRPRVVADPERIKTIPPLTTADEQALKFAGRQGAWKWLRRHPWLKNEYESRKIG